MQFAFVFPGQGSQSIGMLKDFEQHSPIIHQIFIEASEILGDDLWQLIQEGPLEKLNQTEYTQPALLCAGVAVWRIWQSITDELPTYMAGHSLGEYTALVCAGALSFHEAVGLVAERGRLMQRAVPIGQGAMAAIIGLSDEKVLALCNQPAQNELVVPANYNSTGQVIIAGTKKGVEEVLNHAKEAGAKLTKLLPVSVPSHSPLMQPAADIMADLLKSIVIDMPKINVIHNINAKPAGSVDEIRKALVDQLCAPVQWVKTIRFLVANDIRLICECGPGKVLTGLNKRIDKTITVHNLQSIEDISDLIKIV